MRVIKELVKALDKRKLRPIETLNLEEEGDSIYRNFYHSIRNAKGEINENDLAFNLCNTNSSDKKYLMVKSRFRKRLINHILFMDYSESLIEDSKQISKAYKYVFLAKILNIAGVFNASIYLIDKSLPIILKYEILEVQITALQIKINEYSFKNKFNKIESYSKQLLDCLVLLELESKAYIIYQKAGFVFSKAEILKTSDFKNLDKLVNEIKNIAKENKISFRTKWYSLSLQIEFLEYAGKYKQVIEKCNEALVVLNEKPHFNSKARLVLVQTFLLEAYGILNHSTKGDELILKLKEAFSETSFNWFHVQRKILFHYSNTKQYEKAFEVADYVIKSKAFENYNSRFKELWILWHSYFKLIIKPHLSDLKIEKIMNTVVSMSKDQLGVSTSKQVLEIFYKLQAGRENELIDKINILSIHKSRYLKPSHLKRASLFYEFIIKTSKSGFNRKKMKDEAIFTLNKLSELENVNPEKRSYEIIPYEDIIDLIVNSRF